MAGGSDKRPNVSELIFVLRRAGKSQQRLLDHSNRARANVVHHPDNADLRAGQQLADRRTHGDHLCDGAHDVAACHLIDDRQAVGLG